MERNFLLISFFLILLHTLMNKAEFLPTQKPVVCCLAGCIKGKFMPGFQTGKFEAFLGIPYALPPIGELRFRNPKPFPRWWGILNATEAKSDCIQKNYMLTDAPIYGSENCLYLNVYRPVKRSKQLMQVMVYIHGGGFFSGSPGPGLHGPEYFMDTEEVIIVTMAYRLAIFGFLSTSDINMPGNFALKDQNLALRWVQKNIAAFGGNPKTVTIFGQSAGAASVHLHILSKQSKGLFRNAISMSGLAISPFAFLENPLELTRRTAKLCNINNSDSLSTSELTRAFREIDANTLLNAENGLKFWSVYPQVHYMPVVESDDDSDAFLDETPEQSLSSGNYNAVPFFVGFVPNEGAINTLMILANQTLRMELNKNFDSLLTMLLEWPKQFNETQTELKTQAIVEEYLSGQSEITSETESGFVDVFTDHSFHRPLYNAVKKHILHVDTVENPIYLYQFNYSGPENDTWANVFAGEMTHHKFGVVHTDDLLYVFRSPLLFTNFEKNSTEAEVVKAMVGNFIHFAKNGRPKDAENVRPCNIQNFNIEPETLCDYQYFGNSAESGYDIKIDNKFNVRRQNLWNDLLEYELK